MFFITSINTRNYSIDLPSSLIEWLRLDRELDELALILIREASREADRVFQNHYESQLNATGGTTFRNPDQLINRLLQIINDANTLADKAMDAKFNEIFNNWITLKQRAGYRVKVYRAESTYYVGQGYGYSNIYFRIGLMNINGDYRVFSKNVTLYFSIALDELYAFQVRQKRGLLMLLGLTSAPGVNMTMIIEARSVLYINGNEQYVILSGESGQAIVSYIVRLFRWILRRAGYVDTDFEAYPEAVFYYGEGYSWIVYQTDASSDTLEYMTAFFGNRVTLGLTTNCVIDGIYARAALVIRGLRR